LKQESLVRRRAVVPAFGMVSQRKRGLSMKQLRLNLPNLATTQRLGQILGRSLPTGVVILLTGDLGAGKTTLVQGIGQGLGIQDLITSPTFTLIQEYLEGRVPLYHLDLYRLSPSDVNGLYLEGYWEGTEAPLGIMAIEWAERLPVRPAGALQIDLQIDLDQINPDQSDQSDQPDQAEIGGDRRIAILTVTGAVAGAADAPQNGRSAASPAHFQPLFDQIQAELSGAIAPSLGKPSAP
jgi:tRNA threonylcarbamoyladenosine biosynthesis protein TsaE